MEVGGGIRTAEDIQTLLEAGANRVVVGTKAMEDWPWFEWQAKDETLRNKLVLALDAKDGFVATRGWTETSKMLATDVAAKVNGWPLAAILYTDVAKDGMLSGPKFRPNRKIGGSRESPRDRQRRRGLHRSHTQAPRPRNLGRYRRTQFV